MMVGDTTLGESGEGFTNGRKRVLLDFANASVRKSSASIIVCIYIWIEKITSGFQLKMAVKERQPRLHPREPWKSGTAGNASKTSLAVFLTWQKSLWCHE